MLEQGVLRCQIATPKPHKDIKWVEGIRGISALFIVTSHLYIALNESMRLPAESEGVVGSPIRWPFIRLHTLGAPWLAIFFILAGFVNAHKPIKQARNGDVTAALTALTSSTFRRTWRLCLPVVVAICLAWAVTQLGLMQLAKEVGEPWLRSSTPDYTAGWWAALNALFAAIWMTWTGGVNAYDPNLWPMFLLLKGSMIIYIVLLGTIRCSPRYRMLVFFGLWCYSYKCLDTVLGTNVYFGALLSEISIYPITSTTKSRILTVLRRILSISLLLFGGFVGGFPEWHWEFASWSRFIVRMGWYIFPPNTLQKDHWADIAGQCIIFAIVLSPGLQRVLSHRFLGWLGGISFPMYLLHGTLLRSFLPWMLWGWTRPQYLYTRNEDGEYKEEWEQHPDPEKWLYVLALGVFLVVLGLASHYWSTRIEPWFAWVTRKAEERMCPGVGEGLKREEVRESERGLPPVNGVLL